MCDLPPGYTLIEQKALDHLNAFYLSPLSGIRDLGAVLVAEWGHDPEAYSELLDVLEVDLVEVMTEAAADLMRERGLADLRVEPELTTATP